jgi:hypothetical protein
MLCCPSAEKYPPGVDAPSSVVVFDIAFAPVSATGSPVFVRLEGWRRGDGTVLGKVGQSCA